MAYHDEEWGRPTTDDRYLFEKLCLEGFQSGLFLADDPPGSARTSAAPSPISTPRLCAASARTTWTRLMGDAGIVRHRGKMKSVLNNARRAVELRAHAGSIARLRARLRPPPCPSAWIGLPCAQCPRPRNPPRSARSCAGAAGASSARPRSMRSCRRWVWWTTMSRDAGSAARRTGASASGQVGSRAAS